MSSLIRRALLLAILGTLLSSIALAQKNNGGWLFAGFKDNSADGVYFAVSTDGYHWDLVNDGKPVVAQTEPNELMRDPFIQRAPDNTFRMVWTWAWGKPAVIGYASSSDLLHWTKHRQLAVTDALPTALNAWAPAMYYDTKKRDWLIFWSSTVPPAGSTSTVRDHRIYATHTADFEHFTPASLFFDPGYNVIDATELIAGSKHYLLFKDERTEPLEKHILLAKGDSLDGPWHDSSAPFTEVWSEGAASITVPGGYLVYYDHYRDPQHYGAAFSSDLQHWSDAAGKISFPTGMRHGSFLHVNAVELMRLRSYHSNPTSGAAQ